MISWGLYYSYIDDYIIHATYWDFEHYFMEFIEIWMEYEDLMGMWWDIYI